MWDLRFLVSALQLMQLSLLQMKRQQRASALFPKSFFVFSSMFIQQCVPAPAESWLLDVLKVLLFLMERKNQPLLPQEGEHEKRQREETAWRRFCSCVCSRPHKGIERFLALNSSCRYAHMYWKAQMLEMVKVQ